MYIGQSAFDSVVVVRQPFVVDAEQVQNCRMEIVDRNWVNRGFVSDLIGLTVAEAGLDPSARHPRRKHVGMMIPSKPRSFHFGNGVRPNSDDQTTSVSSMSPRRFRSINSAAQG